jgi:hypothetical protein
MSFSTVTTTTRRCPHSAYGPICQCTARKPSSTSIASTSSSNRHSLLPVAPSTSSSRRCRHGSYGPMCACTTPSTSEGVTNEGTSSAASSMKGSEKSGVSLGDRIRSVMGIKGGRRCPHGAYGPVCGCTL